VHFFERILQSFLHTNITQLHTITHSTTLHIHKTPLHTTLNS